MAHVKILELNKKYLLIVLVGVLLFASSLFYFIQVQAAQSCYVIAASNSYGEPSIPSAKECYVSANNGTHATEFSASFNLQYNEGNADYGGVACMSDADGGNAVCGDTSDGFGFGFSAPGGSNWKSGFIGVSTGGSAPFRSQLSGQINMATVPDDVIVVTPGPYSCSDGYLCNGVPVNGNGVGTAGQIVCGSNEIEYTCTSNGWSAGNPCSCGSNPPAPAPTPPGPGPSPSNPTPPPPPEPSNLVICLENATPPCPVGFDVYVSQPAQLRAWYYNGSGWQDVTLDTSWGLANEGNNDNLNEYDYNNSCSAGYCLTNRGIRFFPANQSGGPYVKGKFVGVVTNYRDCDGSSGCPSIDANYGGDRDTTYLRVLDAPPPPAPVPPPPITYSITGYVYQDFNTVTCCSGVKNPAEPGIGGRLVTLKNSSGVIIGQNTTNADGSYAFGNLSNGQYRLEHIVPAGYSKTTEDEINRTISSANVTYNFGLYQIPQVIFVDDPEIYSGDPLTISWDCPVPPSTGSVGINFNTNNELKGSVTIYPPVTTTYTVECIGGPSASVEVVVRKKPFFIEN